MLVLVLVVVGFVMLRDLSRVAPDPAVTDVDYERSVKAAREQADFELLAPERVPPGWRVTSVEFVPQPAQWHLGMLTEEDNYVGLEQARRSPREMVTTYVDIDATQGGEVVIDGERWRSWSDEGGDDALVRRQGGLSTLVVGSADQDVLVDFVTRLQ